MMAEHPAASGQMLTALDFYLGPTREIAVVGTADSPETHRALAAIRRAFRPNQVLAFHDRDRRSARFHPTAEGQGRR